jgi:hypothetical protein
MYKYDNADCGNPAISRTALFLASFPDLAACPGYAHSWWDSNGIMLSFFVLSLSWTHSESFFT